MQTLLKSCAKGVQRVEIGLKCIVLKKLYKLNIKFPFIKKNCVTPQKFQSFEKFSI